MPLIRQTRENNNQFTGAANQGLFNFNRFNDSPVQRRVKIHSLSYYELPGGGGPITTNVRFYATRPAFDPTERIDLGWGDLASIIRPDGSASITFRDIVLPRLAGPVQTNGFMLQVHAITDSKLYTGTVCCDFTLMTVNGDI